MSDNQTTELREKLTVRGVDYEVKDLPDINFFHDTRWNANGVHWCFTEFVGATTCLTMCNEWKDCTPEQAIAATLGGGKLTAELKELVLDLYADLMEYGCTPNAHRANYKPRFEALEIEVGDDVQVR